MLAAAEEQEAFQVQLIYPQRESASVSGAVSVTVSQKWVSLLPGISPLHTPGGQHHLATSAASSACPILEHCIFGM